MLRIVFSFQSIVIHNWLCTSYTAKEMGLLKKEFNIPYIENHKMQSVCFNDNSRVIGKSML